MKSPSHAKTYHDLMLLTSTKSGRHSEGKKPYTTDDYLQMEILDRENFDRIMPFVGSFASPVSPPPPDEICENGLELKLLCEDGTIVTRYRCVEGVWEHVVDCINGCDDSSWYPIINKPGCSEKYKITISGDPTGSVTVYADGENQTPSEFNGNSKCLGDTSSLDIIVCDSCECFYFINMRDKTPCDTDCDPVPTVSAPDLIQPGECFTPSLTDGKGEVTFTVSGDAVLNLETGEVCVDQSCTLGYFTVSAKDDCCDHVIGKRVNVDFINANWNTYDYVGSTNGGCEGWYNFWGVCLNDISLPIVNQETGKVDYVVPRREVVYKTYFCYMGEGCGCPSGPAHSCFPDTKDCGLKNPGSCSGVTHSAKFVFAIEYEEWKC